MSESLAWLQVWYRRQCNGDWEHEYGVKIETLDNPGWSVEINLNETDLSAATFTPIKIDVSEYDWLACSIENNSFRGAGDPSKLEIILDHFRRWAVSQSEIGSG